MKPFRFANASGAPAGLALPLSDYNDTIVLAAATAQTVTVPAGATVARFTATGDFWIRLGAVAVIPSGNVVDGTSPVLNPKIVSLDGVATFSIIAAATPSCCIEWFGPA
jgi:hypothetical protein